MANTGNSPEVEVVVEQPSNLVDVAAEGDRAGLGGTPPGYLKGLQERHPRHTYRSMHMVDVVCEGTPACERAAAQLVEVVDDNVLSSQHAPPSRYPPKPAAP